MHLKTDSTLQNGKFRIIRVLGQGGFGITYLAEHKILGKLVAIKEFFPKDYCDRDDATSHITVGTKNNTDTVEKLKERFKKEARNIAKLNHPGIVQIQDVVEDNNTAYIVMDYVKGKNLNEIVKEHGALSESDALSYIKAVADALDYIHAKKMTHLDIKPANIIVSENDNRPVLIDFGLSKQYTKDGEATSTMLHGVSQGYSALELYMQGSLSSFSPESDIYSLAATLYYLLTGKVPPSASGIWEDPNQLDLPDNINVSVRSTIVNTLSAKRSDRPKSARLFMRRLNERPLADNGCEDESTRLVGARNNKPSQVASRIVYPDNNNSASPTRFSIDNSQNNTVTKNNKNNLLIIIGLVTIIILMIIAFLLWRGNNSGNEDAVPDSETAVVQENGMDQDSRASDINRNPALETESQEVPVQSSSPENDDYYTEAAEPAVPESSAYGAFRYLEQGISSTYKGKLCYYLKGYFRYNGTDYPVIMRIVDNGGSYSCTYHNIRYGGQLKMAVNSSGDALIFNGNDRGNNFHIEVSYSGGAWHGYTTSGSQTMDVYLAPTSQTF